MENQTMTSDRLIAESYVKYRQLVFSYIYKKVNCRNESDDLVQDVFLRLLDYRQMLRENTIRYFIFTIARNVVYDYLRRFYKRQEVTSYLYETTPSVSNDTEAVVVSRDFQRLELKKLAVLPPQRRKIYAMSRFEELSVTDIAKHLNLSRRTVENHLFIGRKEVREFIRQCI